MKINAGEIRVGMLLEYKNDLWQVLKTQHVKPGKGGAFAQVEMKSFGKNTKLNGANYIALGAFFKSNTKKVKYKASISRLKKIKKIINMPIVAIGGINQNNYKKLLLNNADFLAISGYIWKNKKLKPHEAIKNLK